MVRIKKNIYLRLLQLIILFSCVLSVASSAFAVKTLTIDDVRKTALEFNRTYLSAKEDLSKAESEIIVARAGAFPNLTINSYYNRNLKLPSFFINAGDSGSIEFKSGFKNDFGAALSLTQSIWKGGKVINAYKIAKLYKKYSEAGVEQVKFTVINNAEILFYNAILQNSNLDVLQKALEANSYNLEVVEKYYSKGLVSEYEVLRARVEKSNLLPKIISAESELRLSKKRLKSYIGIELNEEIFLAEEPDDTSITNIPPLNILLDNALSNRSEMVQANQLVDITKKAISLAKADYFPELEFTSNYSWSSQSNDFTLTSNQVKAWSAGVNLTIPIFKGGATRGNVKNYTAEHQKAMLAQNDIYDMIRLEVEDAYDRLLQAKKALDIQTQTIAQAEEGLKIANLRYESGVGTLLEVLSAQTALTEARNVRAQASFGLRQARSNLKKATNMDLLF